MEDVGGVEPAVVEVEAVLVGVFVVKLPILEQILVTTVNWMATQMDCQIYLLTVAALMEFCVKCVMIMKVGGGSNVTNVTSGIISGV